MHLKEKDCKGGRERDQDSKRVNQHWRSILILNAPATAACIASDSHRGSSNLNSLRNVEGSFEFALAILLAFAVSGQLWSKADSAIGVCLCGLLKVDRELWNLLSANNHASAHAVDLHVPSRQLSWPTVRYAVYSRYRRKPFARWIRRHQGSQHGLREPSLPELQRQMRPMWKRQRR